MESKSPFVALLRKVGALALFGFLAIVLAGPLLSALLIVLCFAMIGFLLWLPLHALLRRRDASWRSGVEKVADCTQRGAELLGAAWCGTVRLTREVHTRLRGTASFVGTVLLETLSGALVALLLVSTCWPPHSLTPVTVVVAGLAGALVGVLVVASRSRPAAESIVEQSTEGLN